METDAPFLTPHPYRGAPNEPYCLPYTVRALAELRDRPAGDARPPLQQPPGRCMRWIKRVLRVELPACCDTVNFFTIL